MAIKTLKKRRIKLEPVRAKLNIMVRELHQLESFPREEKAFIFSIACYFPGLLLIDEPAEVSLATCIIEMLEQTVATKRNHLVVASSVSDFMGQYVDEKKAFWKKVCKAYAVLEIKIARLH